MRVRKLDADKDMDFGHNSSSFYRDCPEAIAQNIYTRLMLWTGEWFLNESEGTDWAGKCLGKHTEQQAAIEIRSRILGTAGVTKINNITVELDSATRKLKLTGEVETEYGDLRLQFNS